MSKKILVLGYLTDDDGPRTDYATEFNQIFDDYEFYGACFDNLSFTIGPDKFSITDDINNFELSDYDLIFFRGRIRKSSQLAYIVSIYCQLKSVTFFNDYANYRPSSKLAQTLFFYEQKVPFIETYFSLSKDMMKSLINKNLNYPFILKDNHGSHGNDNYLVGSESELNEILTRSPNIQFIAQKYHRNKGDYRILVMGDLDPLVIWRQAVAGSHLNNTSQGGDSSLDNNLSTDIINDAKKLARGLKMTVAGVDLLTSDDTDESFFLEINSQPQIRTGAFVDHKMDKLKDLFNRAFSEQD